VSDHSFIDAIKRTTRERRGSLAYDLRWPVRVAFVRRFSWPPTIHRRLWPIMASPNGRQWWTVGYGNSLFIGPLVVSWRSAPDRAAPEPEGRE
jgi:hypothetical protein